MTRRKSITVAALGLALVGSAAIAQQGQMGSMPMSGSMPGMPMSQSSDMSAMMQNMRPAQREMMAAMNKMNDAMMQGMMDPDPGRAWMKSMAAHHQGAIDMSTLIQHHTKNPEVLAEARKTVMDNQKALAELRAKMR